jgi:hypothetical protein
MMRVRALCRSMILVLIGLGITGCTHTYKVNNEAAVTYSDADRHDLNVELRLTDEFTNYIWTLSRMGDTFRMPLGNALSSNAEAMCKKLFSNVTVVRGSENQGYDQSSGMRGADAVLTPTVTVVERPMGTWAFDKMTTTIGVEWALTNREGTLVWLQTIQGTGEADTGNAFTHKKNAAIQAELAISDLFTQTFDAMSSAPEITALPKQSP